MKQDVSAKQFPLYVATSLCHDSHTVFWCKGGKSTQVPQFILDSHPTCHICVTQPRRIAAIAISDRISFEQCDSSNLIAHQVRLDSNVTADTQLVVCTPGVVLQQLRSSPTLAAYTHIVLDEVHERDKYQEFLLIVLRDILPVRSDLRLVLMSATLATVGLTDYFAGIATTVIQMQGRMFPVQEYFLEDVLSMTEYIGKPGADESVTVTEKEAVVMQCAVCGRTGFSDATELGLHVALCGLEDEEIADDVECTVVPKENFDRFADAEDDSSDIVFASYDVNGSADAVECAFQTQPKEGPAVKCDENSAFEFLIKSDEPQSVVDKMLQEYQTIHDDETVDYGLIVATVEYIAARGDGGVLIFLPGWQEISELSMIFEGTPPFSDRNKYLVLSLHSGIPSNEQRRVLQRPPFGANKIVLSTNIAETSLTIDDIKYVIDSGRAKEKNYDPHLKTSTLQPTWISQASAKQRKGRAGRVSSGICFRLYSSLRHDAMAPFTESELLRTPLEEMCLMCKKLGLAPGGFEDENGIPAFLTKAMSAPHAKSVMNAIELLVDLGAMEPESNELTALGECLSTMSLEPRVGKMVLWSYLLGCSRVVTNMAVAMSYKSPFTLPKDSQRRAANAAKVQLSRQTESDQMMIHYALEAKQNFGNRQALETFCRRNFINFNTLNMVADLRQNLKRELMRLGYSDPMKRKIQSNRNDSNIPVWYAALAAGLYPNVAYRRGGQSNFSTMTNQKIRIHVSSVNASAGQPLNTKSTKKERDLEFVCFGELVKGNTNFTANQTTHLISPLPLILLCGKGLCVRPIEDSNNSILSVDEWISFQCRSTDAASLVILRKRLESAFLRSLSDPSNWAAKLLGVEKDAVDILSTVINSSHRAATR